MSTTKPPPDPSWYRCRYCKQRQEMGPGDLGRVVISQSFTGLDVWEGACPTCRAADHPAAGATRCSYCATSFQSQNPAALRRDVDAIIRPYNGTFEYYGTCSTCRPRADLETVERRTRRQLAFARLLDPALYFRDLSDRVRAAGPDPEERRRAAERAVALMDEVQTAYLYPEYHRWLHGSWPCGEVLDLIAAGHLQQTASGDLERIAAYQTPVSSRGWKAA